MAIYHQELMKFQKTWNMPNFNLVEVEKNVNMLRGARSFLEGNPIANTPANHFVGLLSKTLSIYFETNTQLNATGKYLSSFNKQEFLNSFEALVDAKYRSTLRPADPASERYEADKYTREPYTGASMDDINAVFVAQTQKMNKPLPTLWVEKMKKGSITMNELLMHSGNVMDSMNSLLGEKGLEDKITNVVAAYETMKQFRETRKGFFGWLWKLFNREQNEIEQANLETFESQVNQLREKGYPVDKIAADLTGKTVLGVEVKSATKAKETSTDKEVKNVENEGVKKGQEQDLELENQELAMQLNQDLKGKEITDKSAQVNQQPQISAPKLDK